MYTYVQREGDYVHIIGGALGPRGGHLRLRPGGRGRLDRAQGADMYIYIYMYIHKRCYIDMCIYIYT